MGRAMMVISDGTRAGVVGVGFDSKSGGGEPAGGELLPRLSSDEVLWSGERAKAEQWVSLKQAMVLQN